MTPETRRAIQAELLRGGAASPDHADAIIAELEEAVGRFESDAALQSEARKAPRERRGRPVDVAERAFEVRVLEILDDNGIALAETVLGPAPVILAALRETASDPRNALRRAKRRIRVLASLVHSMEKRHTGS